MSQLRRRVSVHRIRNRLSKVGWRERNFLGRRNLETPRSPAEPEAEDKSPGQFHSPVDKTKEKDNNKDK